MGPVGNWQFVTQSHKLIYVPLLGSLLHRQLRRSDESLGSPGWRRRRNGADL